LNPILVTGCAGFVGSVVSRKLLARGKTVVGLDNLSRGSRSAIADLLQHQEFEFIQGDIRAEADVIEAFSRRPEAVLHLAARHVIPECTADPAGTYDINVVGTERLWSAALAHRVPRFLFASTGDVYKPSRSPHRETDRAEPFNAYGLSKLTSERSLQLQGNSLRATIVRLFNVYGPGDRNEHLVPAVLKQVQNGGRRIELGNLWPVRDYIYVDDAAEAFVRILETRTAPEVVNVGTGGGWTVEQVVETIGRAMGASLTVVSVPRLQRPAERDVLRPNVDRLAAATGWRPLRALDAGMREFVAAVLV
jgi:UDP-glucose 4-epimerase